MSKQTTITRKEMVALVAKATGVQPNEVRQVVQTFLNEVTEQLSHGRRVEFRDFGVFKVVLRKEKVGRNPKNAAVSIVIPKKKTVKFSPGKEMRDAIAPACART